MGASKNRGTPKWMVYDGKSYEQMDDWGVPLFLETPTSFLWLMFFHLAVFFYNTKKGQGLGVAAWLCQIFWQKWIQMGVPYQLEECPLKRTASLLHPQQNERMSPFQRRSFIWSSISRGLHSLTISESIILSSSLLKLTITGSNKRTIFQPSIFEKRADD